MSEGAPNCERCGRSMNLNSAASSANSSQYTCAWGHPVYYVNIHKVTQVDFKTGERKRTQWPL